MTLLIEYQNPYWKSNQQLFLQLLSYIKDNHKYYHWKVKSNRKLFDWINSIEDLEDEVYQLNTKIWWILNGIQSFEDHRVRCMNDNKPFIGKNVRSIYDGYAHVFCCARCAANWQETKDKKEWTTFQHYGVKNSMQSKEVVKYMQDEFQKKHDAKSPMQVEEFKTKQRQSTKSHLGVEFALQNPESLEKLKQTNLKNLGVEFPAQNPVVMKQIQDSTELNNGYRCIFSDKDMRQLALDKLKIEYGIDLSVQLNSPTQIEAVSQKISDASMNKTQAEKDASIEKFRVTCIRSYGVDNPMKDPKIKERSIQTLLKNFGVISPVNSPEIRSRMRKAYTLKIDETSVQFDSFPEVAFYIYLIDHKIPFEYQPNISLQYEYDKKVYLYYPDFIVEGRLVELKGNHFFEDKDPSKKMICPYDRRKDQKYEAKHQCMLKNNVTILTSKDYRKYEKYAISTYRKEMRQLQKTKVAKVNSKISQKSNL